MVQASAVSCRGLVRGRLLTGCSFRLAPGVRALVVSVPEEAGSTLLRVLAGLARPDAGRFSVAGIEDPAQAAHGGRVAYLGPEPGIPSWMTPREAVTLAGRLVDIDRPMLGRKVADALARVELPSALADRPLRRSGPAIAQRAGLAAALVGDPEVLLLDEPLRALAPDERLRILAARGRRLTVLVASRYPRSEAGLVTHVMLLRGGRVAVLAPVTELEATGHPLSQAGIIAFAEGGRVTDGADRPARVEPVAAGR